MLEQMPLSPTGESISVDCLVRRRTGYKDKHGRMIKEGDKVGCWLSAQWDEEVPVFREFIVCKKSGMWFCKGIKANDEDDFLKNFAHLIIIKESV